MNQTPFQSVHSRGRLCPIHSRGRLCHIRRGLAACVPLLIATLFALPASGQPAGDTAKPAAAIRMAGPLAAKEMMEELAAEFGKSGKPAAVDYQRIDMPGYAASALVSGRDMILTFGKLTDKDLSSVRDGWKKLAPQEVALGARAVAVVVHERNGVESLTMEQLQSVFSGKAGEWKVFGGEGKAIRRYGLAPTDPLSIMFHEKVLPAGRCNMVVRKANSAEALAALAGDPQAIAFVDAVSALAAGASRADYVPPLFEDGEDIHEDTDTVAPLQC